jgi:predicted alpha-1,2-mannosidase
MSTKLTIRTASSLLLVGLLFASLGTTQRSAQASTAAGPPAAVAQQTLNLTQFVNPFIGTDDSNVPNPVPGGAGGSTYPGAVVPFGMVQFSPDTPTGSPSGYRFGDTQIQEFSMTHFDGAGCPNNEDLNIMPITGALSASPGSSWTTYTATKSGESAVPGTYRVTLTRNSSSIASELSATTRAGIARFTYPSTTQSSVLVNVSRMATGSRNGSISIVNNNQINGTTTGGGFCGGGTFSIFFSILFDRNFNSFGTFSGGTISNGSRSASGTQAGGFVTFDTTSNRVVHMKVGLSYVSIANAQQNLSTEIPAFDFNAVSSNANTAWNNLLNRIQVSGGTTADMQQFYTALYHVFQSPNVASDVNGQYMGFDRAVHTSSRTIYQNYSGWDIYRSWAALAALVAPEASDIANSMVIDGQQGGEIPKWSHQNSENFIMAGDPGPIIIASLYAFGARNFDTAAALNIMFDTATNPNRTTQGGSIRGRLAELLSQHFIDEDASDSLEYSASDFAIAQFARALGDTARYNTLIAHAQWWANVFSTESSYIHPRNADGSFVWPLAPASNSQFTEGNAAQYTWMVPYNYSSLFNLMGGKPTAVQRLDHLFTQVNAGLTQPFFYIGNEPEHNQPWAYNFAGAPWGAQSAVRRIMQGAFTTGAGGLPGNDDLGATSAWFVWAALGLFPVTPGADTLALHGPLFTSERIRLANGNILQINGSGAADNAPYVQGLTVNGTSTTRTFLRFPDIVNGATLNFTMGSSPNMSWGTDPSDAPPSFNDGWTPPAAAPSLGTNLARGKSATGSATCAAAESPAMAVDGSLMNNSKFCSSAATKFLQVDLGSSQTVAAFVVKHAGLGGENTGWNTAAFNIQTSTDGTNFTTVATVSGSRSSRTFHQIAARTARFVRLNITTPENIAATGAARIYELEVYGSGGGPLNLALNRPATGSTSCNANEGPEKAVNGSVSGGNSDKWCSLAAGTKFLQVDLGASTSVNQIVIRHAGAGGESTSFNTRDFNIQVSTDGTTFTTVATVAGNTASVTTHNITATTARFVRLNVTTPTQTTDAAARIYELEVYGP